ncbi:hypothetical protein ACFB49_20470 [Sphingomonas sp. DBB INV C78]|uniref:DUF3592 domain-containing protein n=1 Tax=Sphingomonas sp. DBB INV C78 TaxID=3349434 RepID=UPI0036D26E75
MWPKVLFFCIGLLIAGLTGGMYGYGWYRLSASDAWEETQARVLASSYHAHESTDSDGDRSVSYEPLIRYLYTVEGREYRGRAIRLSNDTSFNDSYEADDFVAAFPAGRVVPVYYDPADPKDAALIIEPPSALLLIGVAFGAIFMAVGAFAPRFDRA